MPKRIANFLPYLAGAVVFGFFVAHPAQALELSYPSFLPITDTLTIGDMAKLLFNASLGVGSLALVVGTIMAGFQLATSGQAPLKRLAARQRVVSLVAGMFILLGSVIMLNFINPDLTTLNLRNLPLFPSAPSVQLPDVSLPVFAGASFQKLALGKTLDDTEKLIQQMQQGAPNALSVLATDIRTNLAGCTASACQGITPIKYIPGAYVCESCGEGCVSCGWECQQPSQCLADTCTQSAGPASPEPCPGRAKANNLLSTLNSPTFQNLNTFWNNEIKPARQQMKNCLPGLQKILTTYANAAQFFSNAKNCVDCKESSDYFCGNPPAVPVSLNNLPAATRITLKIPELLKKEEEFIKKVDDIATAINQCSCANTQFVCPSDKGCSQGDGTATGKCDDRVDGKYDPYTDSCGPNLWAKLDDLKSLRDRMQTLHARLKSFSGQIDSLGIIAIAAYNPNNPTKDFFFDACKETKTVVDAYEKFTCTPSASTCCPDQTTRADVKTCSIEDFYYCGGSSVPGGGGGGGGVGVQCPIVPDGACGPGALNAFGAHADEAAGICQQESSGDAKAVNPACLSGGYGYAVGLFQFNLYNTGRCPGAFKDTGDPETCIIEDSAKLKECAQNYGVTLNPDNLSSKIAIAADITIQIQQALELSASGTNWCPWDAACPLYCNLCPTKSC